MKRLHIMGYGLADPAQTCNNGGYDNKKED